MSHKVQENSNKLTSTDNAIFHSEQKEYLIAPVEPARRKSQRIASKNQIKPNHSSGQINADIGHSQQTSPLLSVTSTFVYPDDPVIQSSKALQLSNQVHNGVSLERDATENLNFESKNTENQFLSSDVEEDYDTATSYHKTKRLTSQNRTRVFSNPPHSSALLSGSVLHHSNVRSCTQQAFRSLRNYSIHLLAFLMAFIYAVGNIILYTLSCLLQLFRWVLTKLISQKYDSATASPKFHSELHSDLLKFQIHAGSSSSFVQGYNFTERRQENSRNWCFRLVLPLLVLFPLLLVLSLLFSPTDDASNVSSLKLFPFFSDSNCTNELSESRPDNSHLWSLFSWRARCFYVRYFLTSDLDEDNLISEQKISWWLWTPFYRSSNSVDQMVLDTDFDKGGLNEMPTDKIIEKLTLFSQSITNRLDLLSQSIKATDDGLTNLKEDSIKKSDILNLQLIEMKNIFDQHINEWNHFYLKYNQSVNKDINNRLSESLHDDKKFNSIDHGKGFQVESERLLRLANEAANHNIISRINVLRNEILQDFIKSEVERNISLINISALLSGLHGQLSIRTRHTQHELQKLRSQLMNVNPNQSKKVIDIENGLLQLQSKIDLLTRRLSDVEKLNEEYKSTSMYIQDGLKKCARNEELVKQYHADVTDHMNVAITNFSQLLSIQIKEIVQEIIVNELNNSENMNSVLSAYIKQTISAFARVYIDKLIHDQQLESFSHPSGNKTMIAHMIDEALYRFAADRTGLTDYALESAGGSIVGTRCTKTYTEGASLFSIFGLPLARLSNSPRQALQSESDEDGIVLGKFIYDVQNKPIQNFSTKSQSSKIKEASDEHYQG
ncbi:SUN domain-containing protein 2 [Schistosoma japonicum]|nr:SUN domain-containing protein 2 [Schistosoma japonicum]